MQRLERGCSETSEDKQDFDADVPARKELQQSSREPTFATAIVFAASVVRDERMWRSARMWKYDALQISVTCLSKDICMRI